MLTIGDGPVSIDEQYLDDLTQKLLDYTVSLPPRLVIDMQHVEFYGSSFIETLFRVWNRIKAHENGAFAIVGLQKYCREILKITNLDSVWAIYDDVETAVTAINNEHSTLG